jgi:hypothetical protein
VRLEGVRLEGVRLEGVRVMAVLDTVGVTAPETIGDGGDSGGLSCAAVVDAK